MLAGILGVVLITIVAGIIAYIGDRVGHQVGRKRLTLFGLRPKYTSTIVAVATGMFIALAVTIIALAASNLVRTAFFHLSQVNAQISQLEAQQLVLRSEVQRTTNSRVVLPVGQLIPNVQPLVVNPSQSDEVLLAELSSLFDRTVSQLNRAFPAKQLGLRPYTNKANDADVQAKLRDEIHAIRDAVMRGGFPTDTPVLLLPVIGQNLFAGDALTFAFDQFIDRRIAATGDVLASVDVQGGTPLNLLVLQRLTAAASVEAARRGMPAGYAVNVAVNGPQAQAALNQVARVRGRYRLVAKSSIDLYPHSGGVLLDISLVPR